MPENILFYIVFISQIILISYYYPRKILNRMKTIYETYPPHKYPKLYPQNNAYFEKGQKFFELTNRIILAIGVLILIITIWFDYLNTGKVSEAIPAVYFFIQIVPLIVGEFSEFNYFKMMRKADSGKTRRAGLIPRRLFDFVSPYLVGTAFLLIVICILFFYSINQFSFNLNNDTFVIVISLFLTNTFFAGIIFWNLYGKKLDPHQTADDRIQRIEATIKSLLYVSIAASIFFIVAETIDQLHLDYLEPVIMSLYFQIILILGLGSVLRNLRIEKLNFEVYKKGPNAT